jgi:redox-sensing transcriptional repressor
LAEREGSGSGERRLSRALRQRLPHYYRMSERISRDGRGLVAPTEIAEALGIGVSEVAEDAKALGLVAGADGMLDIDQIHDISEHLLGLRPVNTAALIGMGRLGTAIASYEGFGPYGMRIVAVFDADPEKEGRFVRGHRILPMEQLEDVLGIFQIRLAVLTVPPEEAQEVATRLVRAGIQAIWNFAPVHIDAPQHIVVRNENIVVGLAQLCRDLREANLRRLPPEEE